MQLRKKAIGQQKSMTGKETHKNRHKTCRKSTVSPVLSFNHQDSPEDIFLWRIAGLERNGAHLSFRLYALLPAAWLRCPTAWAKHSEEHPSIPCSKVSWSLRILGIMENHSSFLRTGSDLAQLFRKQHAD